MNSNREPNGVVVPQVFLQICITRGYEEDHYIPIHDAIVMDKVMREGSLESSPAGPGEMAAFFADVMANGRPPVLPAWFSGGVLPDSPL